jgi:hypothetical protein
MSCQWWLVVVVTMADNHLQLVFSPLHLQAILTLMKGDCVDEFAYSFAFIIPALCYLYNLFLCSVNAKS